MQKQNEKLFPESSCYNSFMGAANTSQAVMNHRKNIEQGRMRRRKDKIMAKSGRANVSRKSINGELMNAAAILGCKHDDDVGEGGCGIGKISTIF